VVIGGTDASRFTVGTPPSSPVTPGGSADFTITFTPGSTGAKTATVTIANDDSDENPYTFTLSGAGIAPEINLKLGGSSVSSGESHNFGSAKANVGSIPLVLTIENTGTAALNLTDSPSVSITGGDAAMFSLSGQPASPIAPGGSVDLTITFSPTSAGSKSTSLSITSDDSDENTYVILLSGTGTVPDMEVRQGISIIESGTGGFDFGAVLSGTLGAPVDFTIANYGIAELVLTHTPKVAVSGTDAGMFTVDLQPTSPVAPSGSVNFIMTFSPSSPGPKTATVTIENDDPDENPYTFALTGEGGTAPEINVFQGSTNLPAAGSFEFGNVLLGSGGSAVVFTVENLGTADLSLTGTQKVAISGTHAGMFSVGSQPASPIGPSGNATFTITFDPDSVGAKTATVSIANDDADENPYTFTLTGTGVVAPEINVKQGGTDIPSGTGTYGFGDVPSGSSSPAVTFTVENSGNAALNLGSTPKVMITGTDASLFMVGTQPTSPVAPSGSTTFTIVFTPDSAGDKTAAVTIANDDSDENPYTFSLTGNGTGPEMNVKQGAADIPSGTGSYNFGNIAVNSSSPAVVFTVENLGNTDLDLSGTPIVVIGGNNPTQFTVASQPGSLVLQSGSTTFTIVFGPTSNGEKKAEVSIQNNDANENPYTFEVRGRGT
jgi:hypothetical protein